MPLNVKKNRVAEGYAGDHLSITQEVLEDSVSRRATPSLQEVMAEIGRILFCSLGLAALLEIFARAAGWK